MSDHSIIDTLSTRKPAPPTATLLDELSVAAPGAGPERNERSLLPQGPARIDASEQRSLAPVLHDSAHLPRPAMPTPPTVGGFFAEHRALIDGRKDALLRVGMLPQHVNALAMPDLVDLPRAPGVNEATLPSSPGRAPLKMPENGTAATTDEGQDGTRGLEVE